MNGTDTIQPRARAVLNLALLLLLGAVLWWAEHGLDAYKLRIMNLVAINVGLALSLNLVNGFTGQFCLGIAGFCAVGAYTSALLTMSVPTKAATFFITPLIYPLNSIQWSFFPSLLLGGVLAAAVGFAIGAPALRLRGDYLAIATLGFAEIIRVVFTNLRGLTNGALGLKGIPPYTNLWWSYGFAVASVYFMIRLVNSSFGRAFKAVREDEVAAESMGVALFYHKAMAFTISAGMAGIGGALLGNLLTTIDPNMFRFFLTFQILLMVVLGGMGSITGSVIAATVLTIAMELLRSLEEPMSVLGHDIPGIPGMRMVIFSALLMIVVLFWRQGLMGDREITWDSVARALSRLGARRRVEA